MKENDIVTLDKGTSLEQLVRVIAFRKHVSTVISVEKYSGGYVDTGGVWDTMTNRLSQTK